MVNLKFDQKSFDCSLPLCDSQYVQLKQSYRQFPEQEIVDRIVRITGYLAMINRCDACAVEHIGPDHKSDKGITWIFR